MWWETGVERNPEVFQTGRRVASPATELLRKFVDFAPEVLALRRLLLSEE
jgi:hypothetical protein